MLQMTTNFSNAIGASVRRVKAKAELYEGSTLLATYTQNDAIKSIEIERVGEDSKFFGFAVSHKLNIKLRDVPREMNISTANSFKVSLGVVLPDGTEEYATFPITFVTEVNRDENTNGLSITTYDVLKDAKVYTVGELGMPDSYTIRDFVEKCGELLGVTTITPDTVTSFDYLYESGANFEGTETLYDAMAAAAEATQTIFFINKDDELVFRRLDVAGEAVKTITRTDYTTLDSGTNRRLCSIVNTTALGDNVGASTTQTGTTQYIRDNAFLELREDVDTILTAAIEEMGGMTINQFDCTWRGNPGLEPGDKLAIVTKDNETVASYLLNDAISYDGAMSEKTQWSYSESQGGTSNAVTLGEALKQTYARVDKANKEIEMLASEIGATNEAVAAIKVNTSSILASVQNIETVTNETLDSVHADLNTLTEKVAASITADDIKIEVSEQLANGVNAVTTTTGFTFDDKGLTIAKTGSEMSTNIDEDGMSVYRDNTEVLKADNEGVTAYNLHAETYLIVGKYSRFEDYENTDGEARTGCFWIGG